MAIARETSLTRETLREYFRTGVKAPGDLKIGVEWEKLGVYRMTGEAIPYTGERGVEAIFQALADRYGWNPVYEKARLIALEKGGSGLTLEPGGQIELSGKKARYLEQNAKELYTHLAELKAVSEPLGIAWLGLGMHPFSAVEAIEWVPKRRYAIMREELLRTGPLTHAMMKQTASIQISVDYLSEADSAEKLQLAMALAPVLNAMYANSPVAGGKDTGFASYRAHVWSRTAQERTGLIREVFDGGFGFDAYIDYALRLPVLFLIRKGQWIPACGLTFGRFMKEGYEGLSPTLADWTLHLSTIFTDVRLKQYVEIRSVDCQKEIMGLSAPAFVKGLLYDPAARKEAWRRLEGLTRTSRCEALAKIPKEGLYTPLGDGSRVLELARELFGLAEAGLKTLAAQNLARADEGKYLEPLRQSLGQGRMPKDTLLQCFSKEAEPACQIQRVIDCAAI